MRIAALTALVALTLASAAPAQEQAPTAKGPFLFIQESGESLVLLSMAERQATQLGASTTTVTFVSQNGALLRAEAVIEADCTRRVRRTGPIFVQRITDPDVRGEPFTSVPALDWTPPGPLDGPLMDFLCANGRHDASKVSPRPSTFVTPWLEGL